MNMDRWYVGSQNDGLCIIDTKPSPAGTDVVWEGRKAVQHIACLDLITMSFNDASRCAKLMAAAPQMLEALEAIAYWMSDANIPCCFPRQAVLDAIDAAKESVKATT